jgi:hypothetical protein
MLFIVKRGDIEVARISGDSIQFGQKSAGMFPHEQCVPDRDILLQRDAEGHTLWVLRTGRGTVIEEAP